MEALVEVHGEAGLEKAMSIGARIIGVNCRDLATLKLDIKAHEWMSRLLPENCIRVAESGISSLEKLKELKALGYDAALIGRAMANETAMKEIFSCG